ncbi:MAG TPA: hypothetical protein VID47_12695 [Actinomycetota bacterium]
MVRTFGLVAAIAVLLAACDGSPSTPSRTTAPSSLPSTSPIASPSPEADATRMPASETPLEPGRYTFTGFTPNVSYRVEHGWTAGHEIPDFFDVDRPNTVVAFSIPTTVYDRTGVAQSTLNLAPRRALAMVAANHGLHAGPVESTTVGAHPGVVAQLEPTVAANIFGGQFPYTTAAGSAVRLAFVDVDGTLVLVMAVARRRPFGPALADAAELIRSVRFG